jgi:hypothetical protein
MREKISPAKVGDSALFLNPSLEQLPGASGLSSGKVMDIR